MKKVVHISSVHSRYDQRILWRECCSLREQGYDVTLIVNDEKENETLENGVKIISTGFLPTGRIQRMTEGVDHVYRLALATDADIYHLHDPELLTIALRLKQHDKKVIFDSHEIYEEQIRIKTYIPYFLRSLLASGYRFYESYVCKRIDGVVDTSMSYDGNETFLGRSRKVVYVGNFPRITEYEGIFIPQYRKRSGICYSGSISEERGILNLIEAANQVGIEVNLYGRFSSPKFENEILNRNYYSIVNYHGYLNNRKDIFERYTRCAIGVSLLKNVGQYNKYRDMPTKVYEYMAAEMPVIISDCPYHRELIGKCKFGLLADPANITDITNKIRELLENPDEAEEMGKNGKKFLVKQFTWEQAAEPELLRLYREIENS